MSRLSIRQFRSRLAAPRAGDEPLLRAYRELSRRPDLAAGARMDGWIPWGVENPPAHASRLGIDWTPWSLVPAKG